MTESNWSLELDTARRLALQAGRAILTHYSGDFRVDYKGSGQTDPVTEADREANAIIVEGLRAVFPTDGILAEESPVTDERLTCSRLWCVDPLDGTREFVDRNGQFAVMIGLALDGLAQVGVVYQPTEDMLCWGSPDGGGWMERGGVLTRLAVSRCAVARGATLMVSRSHSSRTVAKISEELGVGRAMPMGSVGLKVAQIAQGTADLYISISTQTQEWDACAPDAVLRACGGQMTDVCGQPLRYNKLTTETPRGLLATNGLLHPACVQALGPVARERGWVG